MQDETNRKIARRAFLDYALMGSAALTAGAMMFPVVNFLVPPHETGMRDAEVDAGTVGEVPPGKARKFEFHGKPALLINAKTGFVALSAVCTHLGCIVEWNEEKQQIICPCHNAAFDVNGNIISGPPPQPLPLYDVDVRGDKIKVRKRG